MASCDAVSLFLPLVNHRKALARPRPVTLWATGHPFGYAQAMLSTGLGRLGWCTQIEQKSAEAALGLAGRRGLVSSPPARRRTARTRATNSRGLKGLVT